MGPGFARPPARGVLAGSGTRCTGRVWYKVYWQGLVQGVPVSGTRCSRVWYKVLQGLVQGVLGSSKGVPVSGTRCSRVWYKVFQGLVQGAPGSGTRCSRVWYKVCQGLV